MKSLLIFPPYWCVSHPYLSIPCLSAYLEQNGVETNQIDLNIECVDYFLSPLFIKICLGILENKYLNGEIEECSFDKYSMVCSFLIENIEYCKKILRNSNDFYDIEKYDYACTVLRQAFIIISKAYSPTKISFSAIKFKDRMNKDILVELIVNDVQNPFINFYKWYMSKINFDDVNFIGISIVGNEQIIPAFTLCNIIKKKYPHIHITIGGSVFTKLSSKLETLYSTIFKYIDSIILHEGEYPLLQLIRAIQNNTNFKDIPNLIYMDKISKEIFRNKVNHITDLESLPVPNFKGLPLDKYFSPILIIPYFFSRGCYWGKCTFCDHNHGYDGKYRLKSINKICDDISYLSQMYGDICFSFVDEAIPPLVLEEFCDNIMGQKVNCKWFSYIRAQKLFSDKLCKKMKDIGCLYVMIGVESCSKDVLEDMDKGIQIESIKSTLHNMDKNGIWNHIFLIDNFPTETEKDKFETIMFIFKNISIFHSIGISNFTLGMDSKISKNQKYYGIIDTGRLSDFSTILSYKFLSNDSQPEDNSKLLMKLFSSLSYSCYFANNIAIFREHIPLYSGKYNLIKNKYKLYSIVGSLLHSDKEQFKLKNVLVKEKSDKLILYNMKSNKTYFLPVVFREAFDYLKDYKTLSDIKDFLNNKMSKNNQNNFINFLNTNLLINKEIEL